MTAKSQAANQEQRQLKEQAMQQLWKKRARSFRQETLPYFRYMGQSGFPLFLSLFVITGVLSYFKLIRDVPADFPTTLVGIVALVPVLCWSPFRTFLRAADVVFHMPQESAMRRYWGLSFKRSIIAMVALCAFLLLAYWPIYRQGTAPADMWLLVLAAAVLRLANTAAAWRERQLAWSGMRVLFRVARWGATALAWAGMLTRAPLYAGGFIILLILLFALLYKLPSRFVIPWERLVEEESATRRRYYVFFGLFIDVPTMPSRTAGRKYLSWIMNFIPYRRRFTYDYLYAASMLRMEMGGILLRLLVLFALIAYWMAEAVWLSGWGAACAYAVFMLIVGAQLGGLRHTHRYTVWRHVYPLPDAQRMESLIRLDRWTLLIIALLMWLPACVMLLRANCLLAAAAAPIAALVYVLAIRPLRLRRAFAADAEED